MFASFKVLMSNCCTASLRARPDSGQKEWRLMPFKIMRLPLRYKTASPSRTSVRESRKCCCSAVQHDVPGFQAHFHRVQVRRFSGPGERGGHPAF